MKHSYNITGMSCDGCRSKVEKTLNAIAGVEAVVSLESAIATITMDKHISTGQLQEALAAAGNYTIEMSKPATAAEKTVEEPTAKACCGTETHQYNKEGHQHHKEEAGIPENAAGKYYCPMHCEGEKVYDEPGDCAVCGMHLVKAPELSSTNAAPDEKVEESVAKSCCGTQTHQNEKGGHQHDKEETGMPENAAGKYYCPMHCEGEKVYDEPGDCPVCAFGKSA
jgi:Cu+-exporting ATPase